jgi:hypothetical protein
MTNLPVAPFTTLYFLERSGRSILREFSSYFSKGGKITVEEGLGTSVGRPG